MGTRWGLAAGVATLTLLFAAGSPEKALGQDAASLAARCVTLGGEAGLCAQAATAADWFGRSLGAFAAQGAVSPDVQRTLGRRMPGGAPRVGFSLRPALGGVRHPGLRGLPEAEVDGVHFGAQAALQAGLFEGFQPYPTVGGVFALDAIAGIGWIWLPASDGYDGAERATSLGVRVGLLRESFTAPGIALSLARSWSDAASLGTAGEVQTDPVTDAARLAIGKDLGGVGLHASVGRNWVRNDVEVGTANSSPLSDRFERTVDVMSVGLTLNYLVLRLEGELGWAFGSSSDPVLVPAFDPSEGTPLGGLSVRVIF